MTARVDKALAELTKKYGDGVISPLSDRGANVETTSSGLLGLDIAMGIGGYPRGRIVEIFGPEAGGKTTLALKAIVEAQQDGGLSAFIDAEHAFDPHYAQALGVDTNSLLLSQPDYGEQALEILEGLVETSDLDVIVVDSVAALTPKSEIDGNFGDAQMGAHARLLSQACRKLTARIAKTGTVVIFINQIRMKIGVMFGSPETTTGGGALRFYASMRLDVRSIGKLKIGEEPYGNRVRVKVTKNKLAPPFREHEFDMVWGKGPDRAMDLLDLSITAGIVEKSGAWFSYLGDRIGQGKNNAADLIRKNPKLASNLEAKIRKALLP